MVAIVGIGMMTAVGLSAPETSASVRAGIVRCRESRVMAGDGSAIVTAAVPARPRGSPRDAPATATAREEALLRMAAAAITEAAHALHARAPLFIGVPDDVTGDDELLAMLAAMTADAVDARSSRVVRGGREAGLAAVAMAAASGSAYALAGGVDSLLDPKTLATLVHAKRARCESIRDGFVPGEGAGFLGLARDHGKAHARIVATSANTNGELTAAMDLVLAADQPAIERVFASMNGERRWAMEWALARARLHDRFTTELRIEHPAESYGDIGAASGPVLAGLAALERHAGPALVYASGDHGGHALLVLAGGG
jgi:3-oxoacyl-[acyl-carrier-protein] synthase I